MDEKSAQKLNELRSYANFAPYLLPMLEKRKKAAQSRLISNYHSAADLLGPTAEIAILYDMEREILSKLKELESFNT